METKIVKLDARKANIAKVKEAAGLVDSGGLVAFPTETVYGIGCRVESTSLEKLDRVKRRKPDKPYTLHIGQKSEVWKYVPTLGLRAKKLVDRAWPGPVTIVFELSNKDVKRQRDSLNGEIFDSLYRNNSIGIRCPDNPIASILLRVAQRPVVAPSANRAGEEPAVDAEGVLAQFSGELELVLDGGPCKHRRSSTVVKIGKNGLEILREGVVSKAELEAMSSVQFLFVCTGNSCRSPMAAGIFRKYLAEKLACEVDRLEEMGYKVGSSGTMDVAGLPASAEAIVACAAKGVDITAHRSRPLSRELVEESDFIFAMTRMHGERVVSLSGEAAGKCVLLDEDRDIPDPIGQPQECFDSCAELIEDSVRRRIGELEI
jgi:L-threonylcarbamoyladenylate synthase